MHLLRADDEAHSVILSPFFREMGDEARYTMVAMGPYPSPNSQPGCWIESFEPVTISFPKKKSRCFRICFSFLERVTRLELATSTLARWRSTG